jgi:hypothetical protein
MMKFEMVQDNQYLVQISAVPLKNKMQNSPDEEKLRLF